MGYHRTRLNAKVKGNSLKMQKQRKSPRAEAPRKATTPNAYAALKSEISRVSRKEVRGETQALKKSISQYRTQIADLKRRMQALEQQVKRLRKVTVKAGAPQAEVEPQTKIRFSAKSLIAQRRRLGLSAAALARLLGVSALSVYKWESGNTRPRAKQIEAIAALRGMGKRDVAQRLEG
jgi:DNA-binding transcriptional regulator YiaG